MVTTIHRGVELDRDVLLVGSVGLSNAEEVFRTTAGILGDLAPRLTDGETGWARSVWIQCQRPYFLGNPALEMVEPDPDRSGELRPARVPSSGIYGHTMAEAYRGRARLRPGVHASDIRFDNLGYADWAQESYQLFARLKSEGVIPSRSKFQACLPAPSILLNAMVLPDAQPDVAQAYAPALLHEIKRMLTSIPADQLAIQWDCTHPISYESADATRRQAIVDELARLSDAVPAGVELGYHLCYGDFEHRHPFQPPSLLACVEIANGIVAGASREVNWIHMPVPRDRTDSAYVEPLRELRLTPSTRLYLGLVHYTDGVEGTRERIKVASAVYPDFGIATECGMGRRVGQDIPKLLRIHTEAATSSPVAARTT